MAGRSGAAARHGGLAGGHAFRAHRGRRVFPGYWYGAGYYPYYDSYDSGDGVVEEPQVMMQTAPPESSVTPTKSAESLVMELRGNHWVRLTSQGPMEIAGQSGQPQSGQGSGQTSPAAAHQTQMAKELPAAVLVFRDGHQEEAVKYTIVGKTIYIKSDYWSSGSWTREVQIADLDVAATLKVNQERGAKFSLPSRPSEVIFRP